MDAWIWITIGAAFAQTLRFALQKRLKVAGFSTMTTTLARFLYSAPLVAVGVFAYAEISAQALPATSGTFWFWSVFGGTTQILATLCTVALFGMRNFAVGITFKKTEVLMTAVFGLILLGDPMGAWGRVALAIGLLGVLALSEPPELGGARFLNKATGLGLLSGVFFALSAVSYRAAALDLPSGDTALRAGLTLATTTAFQSVAMMVWMGARNPADLKRVFTGWRVAWPVGLTSMIGSFCWFAAFALQNAAYVNAVGQIELIFSLAMGWLMFGERVKARELAGIGLLLSSILLIVLL
jgi:drug/metabolite transporter (DMT)-like permease